MCLRVRVPAEEALRRWLQVNEGVQLVHRQINPEGTGQGGKRARDRRHEGDGEEEGDSGGRDLLTSVFLPR